MAEGKDGCADETVRKECERESRGIIRQYLKSRCWSLFFDETPVARNGTQAAARGWHYTLMGLMGNPESSYFLSGCRVTMASVEGQKYWQKRFFAMMDDSES